MILNFTIRGRLGFVPMFYTSYLQHRRIHSESIDVVLNAVKKLLSSVVTQCISAFPGNSVILTSRFQGKLSGNSREIFQIYSRKFQT